MSKQSEQTKQLEYQAAIAERNVQAKQLELQRQELWKKSGEKP